MSNLHWKLRKSGYSYRKAYSEVAKKAINLKVHKPYIDSDRDGVINKYDCQPINKWRQDITTPYFVRGYENRFDENLGRELTVDEQHDLNKQLEWDYMVGKKDAKWAMGYSGQDSHFENQHNITRSNDNVKWNKYRDRTKRRFIEQKGKDTVNIKANIVPIETPKEESFNDLPEDVPKKSFWDFIKRR